MMCDCGGVCTVVGIRISGWFQEAMGLFETSNVGGNADADQLQRSDVGLTMLCAHI